MTRTDRDGKVLVLCDFDGTVSRTDVGYQFFVRFTGQGWRDIDAAYCRGEIGSRQAYARAAAILEGDREGMLDFVLNRAELDRDFPAFRHFCRERGWELIIVSDGLDFYIDAVLRRHGLEDIPVRTNRAVFPPGGPPDIQFPWASEDCGRCGTCKREILRALRDGGARIIYVGDGHSDVCPSAEADLVFAKRYLLRACEQDGRPCVPFDRFGDVQDFLARNPFPLPGARSCRLRGAPAALRIEENPIRR
jgi:2,3-diketo-5-methylthio-1-phosphopentane phosphatase